jgi:Protein of unknown function (DUF2973)
MLQLLYILAFTFLAFIAVGNLIRNLLAFGNEARQPVRMGSTPRRPQPVPHPEMLDDAGRVVQEPLLVMRSIGIDDMRDRLDAIYDSSPESSARPNEEDEDDRPPLASI